MKGFNFDESMQITNQGGENTCKFTNDVYDSELLFGTYAFVLGGTVLNLILDFDFDI